MYGDYLAKYVQVLAERASVTPEEIDLLDRSLGCLLASLGRAVGGKPTPAASLLTTSARLLLLTEGLSKLPELAGLDGVHYLVALGYEQTGVTYLPLEGVQGGPLEDDRWFRLAFAALHYLAGGFRVQAFTAVRALERLGQSAEYEEATRRVKSYLGGDELSGLDTWTVEKPAEATLAAMRTLGGWIRRRRGILLADLGEGREEAWLASRGIGECGVDFWTAYLEQLRHRGITAFTEDQGDFDRWLLLGRDVVVLLPTGGGKTLVGELMTALACAGDAGVIWLLPTRALVRQVRRQLGSAFDGLGIDIGELPTTEDSVPLFADDLPQRRQVSVTTPERLSSLIRANPQALENVGLVVFDEAHLLLDGSRGVTAELVLTNLRSAAPKCSFVLMTGAPDVGAILPAFLAGRAEEPVKLESKLRPTRRVYGVLTEVPRDGGTSTVLALYPPISRRQGERTYELEFKPTQRGLTAGPTKIAQRFARSALGSGLRTVYFVSQKRSTETQAHLLSDTVKGPASTLPAAALARLRVELGRPSSLEGPASRGVASHHAGLTPLEQHLVERWVEAGIVRTVFATPTLAQGINLPFDMAVVTFTKRRENEGWKDLEPSEVMNMLGRAGRAGWVSDGICAVAEAAGVGGTRQLLERSRRVFFAPEGPRQGSVGFAELLSRTTPVIGELGWLAALGVLQTSDVQLLLSFAVRASEAGVSTTDDVVTELRRYASFETAEAGVLERVAPHVAKLIQDLRAEFVGDPVGRALTMATGLPPDYLRHVVREVRKFQAEQEPSAEEWIAWSDSVVRSGMEQAASSPWYGIVFKTLTPELLFGVTKAWRSGRPVAEIEAIWSGSVSGAEVREEPGREDDDVEAEGSVDRQVRMRVGAFLNHDLSLLSRLWGAIPACAEILELQEMVEGTSPCPVLVREGVPRPDALVWHKALGGVDRVLAAMCDSAIALPGGGFREKSQWIRRLLRQWSDGEDVPESIDRTAIRGVAAEVLR